MDKKTVARSMKRQRLETVSTHQFHAGKNNIDECPHEDCCEHKWDKGCLNRVQFTSHELDHYAKKAGITLSMGKTGVCWDNAIAESFWATLKVTYFYRHAFTTRSQVIDEVATWIEVFYNHKRLHSALGTSPLVVYELILARQQTENLSLAA